MGHHQSGQGLALILGQEQSGLPARCEQLPKPAIIGGFVDTELVARACDLDEPAEGVQVGRFAHAHRHAFAGGQPDVVAPFLLHARQNRLLFGLQVDPDGGLRLHRALTGVQTQTAEFPRQRGIVRRLRLDLEQQGAAPQAETP